MSAFIQALRTYSQPNILPIEREQAGKTIVTFSNLIKIASVISAVVTAIFFAAFPSMWLLALAAGTSLLAHDSFRVATNLEEIISSPSTERRMVGRSAEGLYERVIDQLEKGILIASPLVRIFANNIM